MPTPKIRSSQHLMTRIRRSAGSRSESPCGSGPRTASVAEAVLKRADDPDPHVRFSSPCRWATGTIPGPARPWRRSPAGRIRPAGSARRCSARRPRTSGRSWRSCSRRPGDRRRTSWSSRWSPWRARRRTARGCCAVVQAVGTPAGQEEPIRLLAVRRAGRAARRRRPARRHPIDLADGERRAGRRRGEVRRPRTGRAGPRASMTRTSDRRPARRRRPVRPRCEAPRRRRRSLVGLLTPRVPVAVAARRPSPLSARGRDPRLPELLLAGWKTTRRRVRDGDARHLLSEPKAWTRSLLSALEDTCTPARRDRPVAPAARCCRARDPARPQTGRRRLRRDRVAPRQAVEAYSPSPKSPAIRPPGRPSSQGLCRCATGWATWASRSVPTSARSTEKVPRRC